MSKLEEAKDTELFTVPQTAKRHELKCSLALAVPRKIVREYCQKWLDSDS
jgi:hypothetical protein